MSRFIYPIPEQPSVVSETPNGREYYQNRIDFYTTSTEYTAESIHQIGLSEVSRIRTQMEQVIEGLEFKGGFEDVFDFSENG